MSSFDERSSWSQRHAQEQRPGHSTAKGYESQDLIQARKESSDLGKEFGSVREDEYEAEARMRRHADREFEGQADASTPLVPDSSRASAFFSPSEDISPVAMGRDLVHGRLSERVAAIHRSGGLYVNGEEQGSFDSVASLHSLTPSAGLAEGGAGTVGDSSNVATTQHGGIVMSPADREIFDSFLSD